MFWNPNQTGQRKQKESPLARKPHPQTAPRKPANSNRETILLEPHATPTKQTTEGSSNREKNATFTSPPTRRPQPHKASPPSLQLPKSNRQPKLLETLQLQQNKQPRVVLIDNFYIASFLARSIFRPHCRERITAGPTNPKSRADASPQIVDTNPANAKKTRKFTPQFCSD